MLIVTSPTLSNIASSLSSTTLLNPKSGRTGAIIFNDSTANLFISFAGSASTSSFVYKLTAGQSLQINESMLWQGQVCGVWDAANGFARVTEFS